MNKFIMVFLSSVMLISCTTEPKKIDVSEKINLELLDNPSAAGGTGTNYYVCDDGDDNNDGLSELTPWKSFSKGIGQYKKIQAGDAILFCRGGVFYTTKSERIANFNCLVSNPCIISDYYNPVSQVEDVAPLIISQHTDAVFNFQDPGRADHDEGYLLENFNLTSSIDQKGVGFNFYNDIDDVQLVNITISSFNTGVYLSGSNKPAPGSDALNERITGNDVFGENLGSFVSGIGSETFLENLVINEPIIAEPVVAVLEPIIAEPVVAVLEPIIAESVTAILEPVVANTEGTYFVCDTGSDENDGLSPSAPWLTFAKAMGSFKYLKSGESINFCRGGVFYIDNRAWLSNYSCLADNRCRIGDYYAVVDSTSAELERPKIISNNGSMVFNFADGGNADQDGGYLVENLILKSAVVSGDAAITLFNDVDDLTIRNVEIDGFSVGIEAAGTNTLNEGSNKHNERIIFENNQVINNSGQGWLGGCSDCEIRGNLFENNGYKTASLNHNIYFAGHDEVNVIIADNILRKSTFIDGACRGVSLVMHGTVKNLIIENNLIEEEAGKAEMSCYGIAVDPGYATEESFEHLIIRGNTIKNLGGLGFGCASCVDVLIENNTFINENEQLFTAVIIPNKTEDALKSSGIVVQNNEVIISSTIDPSQKGFKIRPQDGDYALINNKVYFTNQIEACAILTGEVIATEAQCAAIKN